jgi:hypothetical protein
MNNNEEKIDNSLMELQKTQELCEQLMKYPKYKKLGFDGVFSIVDSAKSVGIDPLAALNWGMYPCKGRVEMSSVMMNTLIRQAGHSITKDKRSDETICILHGKRSDTKDTWVESFSLEDAKKAGVAGLSWKSYPKDMLFARALSRLARQLFPDVIKGCYVKGEISEDISIPEQTSEKKEEVILPDVIGEDGAVLLEDELSHHPDYRDDVYSYLERQGIQMKDVPTKDAEKIYLRIEKIREEETEVMNG